MLGLMYYTGDGVAQDVALACMWFEKAAEQGDNTAQQLLSEMYRNGEGVAKNAAMAKMLIWQLHQCHNTTAAQQQAA